MDRLPESHSLFLRVPTLYNGGDSMAEKKPRRGPWWVAYPSRAERKLLEQARGKLQKEGEKLNHTELLVRLAQSVVG